MNTRRTLAILAGTVIALAGLYAGASWYAGREAQARIEQLVEQANLGLAAQWPVTQPQPVLRIDEYRRGWFSSRIRYTLAYQDADGHARGLHFQDALAHGPLPWAALRMGDWRPAIAYSRLVLAPGDTGGAWFDGVENRGAPLAIDTRIAFDGKVHAVWRLAAAQVRGQAVQVGFSAGRMTVDYDPATRASVASGALDHLALIMPDTGERLRLEGLSIQGDSASSGEDDGRTSHRLRIQRLALDRPDQPAVEAHGIEVGLDAARTGALVDGRLAYALDQLRVGELDMGRLEFQASAQHVDAGAFQALQQTWEDIAAAGDPDAGLDPADRAALLERLRPVLAAAPSVAIDALRWRNAQGQSQASLAVDFTPPGEGGDTDLGAFLERAIRQLRLNLEVSKAMLVETARRVNPGDADRTAALASMLFDGVTGRLARAGLVRVEDGAARLELAYSAGRVTLNGQAMPVADFLALVSPWLVGPAG
ncbi:YdgA family protein [Castellaniella sp. S9]|uniref:YdgA family protein n=1 Tax=Castellaniella sp. S9 TaxID=2993652 RepID=UPI0022B476FD|nr:YdgA family protein [Castellaniella sp. S9]